MSEYSYDLTDQNYGDSWESDSSFDPNYQADYSFKSPYSSSGLNAGEYQTNFFGSDYNPNYTPNYGFMDAPGMPQIGFEGTLPSIYDNYLEEFNNPMQQMYNSSILGMSGGTLGSQMTPGSAALNQMPPPKDTDMLGSIGQTLANLFNSKGGVGGIDALGKLAAAAYTENQRKKSNSVKAVNNVVQQQQPYLDPTKPMRDTAVQQFQQTVADPMSVPIVRSQIDAMTQAQRIKDAAAGRRSNDIAGNMQIMGKAGEIGNNYLNTMSRYNVNPQSSDLMRALYPQAMQSDASQGGALSMALSNLTNGDDEMKQALLAYMRKQAGIA